MQLRKEEESVNCERFDGKRFDYGSAGGCGYCHRESPPTPGSDTAKGGGVAMWAEPFKAGPA